MSRFYGTVEGQSSTCATRRGNKNILVAAQSYDGSVITELTYNENEELIVSIGIAKGSSCYSDETLFKGTIKQLKEKLKA